MPRYIQATSGIANPAWIFSDPSTTDRACWSPLAKCLTYLRRATVEESEKRFQEGGAAATNRRTTSQHQRSTLAIAHDSEIGRLPVTGILLARKLSRHKRREISHSEPYSSLRLAPLITFSHFADSLRI